MTYIPTILEVTEAERVTAGVKEDLKAPDKAIADILKKDEDEEENSRRDD